MRREEKDDIEKINFSTITKTSKPINDDLKLITYNLKTKNYNL